MHERVLESNETGPRGGLFITAIGTEIGKTLVTTILCHQLKCQGRAVLALKPVVSGFVADDVRSDPALIASSLGESSTPAVIAAIAPWRFARPVSPHLAARHERRLLCIEAIADFCNERHRNHGGIVLVEGAGGLMTPLNDRQTNLDLLIRLGHPAVLVTGTYLGALSHSLTALFVLRASGVSVRGIVVSESTDSAGLDDTMESLRAFAGQEMPLYRIPRLAGDDSCKWREAPALTGLCDLEMNRIHP